MKISLCGSFNYEEGYLGGGKALSRAGVEVSFVPAHRYFAESPNNHVDLIIKDLKEQNPDYVLWWRAETLEEVQLKRIKQAIKVPFLMYSWDDPHQFECPVRSIQEKTYLFDYVFTCCESSIPTYNECGCHKAFYCPPGFDPEVHFAEEDEKYKCDISFVGTNLYHGNSITRYHHLSRRVLLEAIINNFPELDIRIYGSKNFENIFPDHYRGWINFNESRKVFYNSKINICTHIRPDGYKYFNERVTQIMGSKGLLLVDEVNGMKSIFGLDKCVYMDLSSISSLKTQITDVLENKEKYDMIRENAYSYAKENLNWDVWAKTLLENIK